MDGSPQVVRFDATTLWHVDAAEWAPSTASKADMCAAKGHVRFTPNSDRESGFPQTVIVRFTPESGHVRCN
jgi:hypothetical protein